MKLLLQQLGTPGEVLDCTTLCKPSPHPCLPRANHTHQIWLMARGALPLLGFITFWFFNIYSFHVSLPWGPKPGLGSVRAQIRVGLWWCFALQRCWQQEIKKFSKNTRSGSVGEDFIWLMPTLWRKGYQELLQDWDHGQDQHPQCSGAPTLKTEPEVKDFGSV